MTLHKILLNIYSANLNLNFSDIGILMEKPEILLPESFEALYGCFI